MSYLFPQKISLKHISHFGLYLFAFSIPISFVPAQFGVVIAFLGWLLEGIINKRWQLTRTSLYIPIVFYLVWNIIASASSPRSAHSLMAIVDNEWPMLIMFLMMSIVDNVIVLRRIAHLWLFSASVASVYGIWQTFSGYQLHRPETLGPMGDYFRAVGFNGFYLTFAGFMMSVFFVSFCLSIQSHIKRRWFYIVSTIISFLAVIGTFARSIWISFAFVIPILGFVRGKRIGNIISIFFIAVVLFFMIFVPSVRERAISSVIPSENETRINLWKTSLDIAIDHPILGIGEDNFTCYFDQYKVEGFYDTYGHPHNDYLNILVSSGIPGLIAFIIIWLVIIRSGFYVYKNSQNIFLKEIALGSTLAIVGFLVGGFFQNYYGTFANCWGWWFMAGLTMTSYNFYKAEKTNQIIL